MILFYSLSVVFVVITLSVLFLPFNQLVSVECDNETVLTVQKTTSIIGKALGLSFKNKLKSDGLLFIFRNSSQKTFWNLGARFPFDIFWLSESGEVLGKILDINPPKNLSDIKAWTSPRNCRSVLEIPATLKNREDLLKCVKIKINQIKQ